MPGPKQSAKAIFLSALEIEGLAAREAHVLEACGEDDSLRKEVLALLQLRFFPASNLGQLG